MKIAITGASGFIGSRFIEMFASQFSEVVAFNNSGINGKTKNVNFISASMIDSENLVYHTQGCEMLIHCAFDHRYKENIKGINIILDTCKKNHIKRLIHISTVSVYDQDCTEVLNEKTAYSHLKDPYTKQKQKIEKILETNSIENFKIIALQPTIIFGLGGNWTKYAFHAAKAKQIQLPDRGERKCNAIYIDDLVQAIYAACIVDSTKMGKTFEKILISGEETISWELFFNTHVKLLRKLGLPSVSQNVVEANNYEFHSNALLNLIFILWFKTPLGSLLDFAIGKLKEIRGRKYIATRTKDQFKDFIKSPTNGNIVVPLGVTRKACGANFIVNTNKAMELLNYRPSFSFEKGMESIEKKIKTEFS